jgi:glycosyltransferase involved in cell wall biosynthesis
MSDATMLSICTTVKNRSIVTTDHGVLRLFPNCVESIVAARKAVDDLELVVADWESDDWPLAHWLVEAARPVPVRVLTLTGTFSRGRGLNVAAEAALGEYLFFIDADALINEKVLRRGLNVVQQHEAFFPILYSYTDPQHHAGYWREAGFGHCMIHKQTFERVGGWPEYNSWGREDDLFWARVAQQAATLRERTEGLVHQWHPDDIDFKNRYGEVDEQIRIVRARAEQANLENRVAKRLQAILRREATVILVDEERTDIKDRLDNRVIPFVERAGRYWGPPADDAQAVRELERLRRDGAEIIVFPWLASWWLEHYCGLAEHLRKTSKPLADDELMTVYDLTCQSVTSSTESGLVDR